MTVESAEKRDHRLARERRHLAAYQHALRFFEPYEALRQTFGMYATWDAVRRVASEVMNYPVKDVGLAWQIARFVRDLPDGKKRLRTAADDAVRQWESEVHL